MYKKYIKRFFDLILALVLLILLLPLMILIILAIKVSSEGPVFFIQERAGKNRRYFRIIKFRTMVPDPEKEKQGFEPGNAMRITRIGKFLRATKLDELPQLINVLRGEMSFVGPRPEVKRYVECYPEDWDIVLSVSPGITDLASIKFRHEEKILQNANNPEKKYINEILPEKLKLYKEYVNNVSFTKDIEILLKTFFVIFKH